MVRGCMGMQPFFLQQANTHYMVCPNKKIYLFLHKF